MILPARGVHIPDGWLKQYGAFQQPLSSFSSAGMYWKDCCTGLKADLGFLNKPIKKVNRNKGSDNKIPKSFTEEQFKKVKEWLGSYDYSDSQNQ